MDILKKYWGVAIVVVCATAAIFLLLWRESVTTANVKYWVAGIFAVLAIVRIFLTDSDRSRIDHNVMALFVLALVTVLIPIERIAKFGGFGIEFVLEDSSVDAAINSQSVVFGENAEVLETLKENQEKLGFIDRSRILWIDNVPATVIAYRRLLRSLGADIVPAHSGEKADEILDIDQDFDLIITDTKWCPPVCDRYAGVDYIVELRKSQSKRIASQLPVIFVSTLDDKELRSAVENASRQSSVYTRAANSPAELVREVVYTLSIQRSRAMNYQDQTFD